MNCLMRFSLARLNSILSLLRFASEINGYEPLTFILKVFSLMNTSSSSSFTCYKDVLYHCSWSVILQALIVVCRASVIQSCFDHCISEMLLLLLRSRGNHYLSDRLMMVNWNVPAMRGDQPNQLTYLE